MPLIEAIRRRSDGLVSVDTYKPAVADACLRAGADVINDVSALHDPGLAEVIARWDAGFVLMHTVGPPKVKLLEPDWYPDGVATEVASFFDRKLSDLEDAGVPRDAVLLDPGIDFSKTPRQSVELLHDLQVFDRFERPLLLALSRKDFVGAITPTSPRQRDPGTLAAMGFAALLVADTVFRVHEVDQSRQFLDVGAVLRDPDRLGVDAQLATGLRLERASGTDGDEGEG